MEENILVSVITVTYNSEHTIQRTMDSVLNQTYQNIEYLIVDGNSKDATMEIVRNYEKKFREKGYQFRIISEPDEGMYDALNKGVKLAKGEIIGQINSDDWYETNAVERVVEEFEKQEFDVCWADLRVVKESGNIIKKAKLSSFLTTRYWNHPTTFIRAELYKKNLYILKSMFDDFDLILRLKKQKCKMVVINEVFANFSFGGMSTQKSWKEMKKRIGYRCQNYRRNGYGFIYYIDSACMEFVKFILA